MKHNQLIDAAKEVAYVPSLDRICVVTAWLGHHAIVDLGFADQRLTATVPVEGMVVFKRQGTDQTLIDLMARPESGPTVTHTQRLPHGNCIGDQIDNCADQVADR